MTYEVDNALMIHYINSRFILKISSDLSYEAFHMGTQTTVHSLSINRVIYCRQAFA